MSTGNRLGVIRGTRLRFLALAVAAVMVTPAAIAWACGPQAQISPNQGTFGPGQSGTVTGINFITNMSVTIGFDGGPTLATVTIPASTGFTVGFTAPQAAGTYNIVARGEDPQGNLVIRTAPITVAAPAPASAPSTSSAPSERPASAAEPAPAESAAGAPATAAAPTTSAKRGAKAETPSGRPVPTRTANQIASSRRGGATAPAVVQPAGQSVPVFAGSAPLATTRTFAPSSAPAPARSPRSSRPAAAGRTPAPVTARPSESTAQAGAWSGMGSSADAALVPTGRFPETATSVNTTARTLSVLLLALGVAGLVGGVGVSELRRRRRA